MAIVFENVLSGEKRTIGGATLSDLEKLLFYVSNPSIWQLVPLTDPGA